MELPRLEPEIAQRVAHILSGRSVPGAAVGDVRGGQLVAFEGFGEAKLGAGAPPTPDTLFRVASITKTFTATAIMQLRDRGKLGLDDPLVRHIPEFRAVRARRGSVAGVTLRRLLAHLSGLASEAPHEYWETYDFPAFDRIIADLERVEIAINPDTEFKYSNLAFALLGEVVKRLSGQDYASYVRAEILAPLGMSSTAFTLAPARRRRLATGYEPDPFGDQPKLAPQPLINGLEAAGQMYTCVRDLARWVAFQLHSGPDQDARNQILSAASIDEMHRPQFMAHDWSSGYCLGFSAQRRGDLVYHGHGGALPGYRSAMLFNKSLRFGAIVLTNLGWHDAATDAACAVLDDLAAKAPSGVAASVRSLHSAPSQWSGLLGIYARHGIPAARVEHRAGELMLKLEEAHDRLSWAQAVLRATDDPNVFEVEGGGRFAGEFARFQARPDGGISHFGVGGFVFRKLG